jgi:hypothetical protein
MTRPWLRIAAACVVLAGAAPSLRAHHAESAEYDVTKEVKVSGTISKVEWTNPHVWFYVDVKDARGKVTTWGFSGAPPGMLVRRGLTKDVLKVGAMVNVDGLRAKDGSNNAASRRVTFADGRDVFTAPVDDK